MWLLRVLGLFFFFPVLAQAVDVSGIRLVRVHDGHAYNCRESYEAGKTAFFPELAAASASEDSVQLSLSVRFVGCVAEGGALGWKPRRPLDPILGQDGDGNPVRIELRDAEFFFGNDDYDTVQVAPAGNEPEQILSLRAPLARVLSEEQKARLEAGQPVTVRTVLVSRAIATAFTVNGPLHLGYLLGQTYTVFFTLRKNGLKALFSALTLPSK